MAAKQQKQQLGRAILFGQLNYSYDDKKGWIEDSVRKDNRTCEVVSIDEVHNDRIMAGNYVLPLSDATIYNSPSGLTYAYNVSLPYLKEIAHLAEVEKNIVIGQAYLYQGKNIPSGKPSAFMWFMVIMIAMLAIIGMLK